MKHFIYLFLLGILLTGCANASSTAAAGDSSPADSDSDSSQATDDVQIAGDTADSDSGRIGNDQYDQIMAINTELVAAKSGPADSLWIDGSVHTGYPWGGENYEGVWGEAFLFEMSNYPITWAISTVHASLLYQMRGFEIYPNTILAIAIRNSRMECADAASPSNVGGCFQMSKTNNYVELQRVFPERYVLGFEHVVGDDHFETAALSEFYYSMFLMSMLRMHSDNPADFFDNHADVDALNKTMFALYREGPFWEYLPGIFTDCGSADVIECYADDLITSDHTRSIINYAAGLNGTEQFDVAVSYEDLVDYWNRILPMYKDVNHDGVLELLAAAFNKVSGGAPTISFREDIGSVLAFLIDYLPQPESQSETTARACEFYYTQMPSGVCL